jgi:hypothetical protein
VSLDQRLCYLTKISLHVPYVLLQGLIGDPEHVPMTTLVPSSIRAVAAWMHFSRCFNELLQMQRCSTA